MTIASRCTPLQTTLLRLFRPVSGPVALVALTLGASSLAHAQYGTTPPYGGNSNAGAPPVYPTPGYTAPPNYTPPATQPQNVPPRTSTLAASSGIAQTLNNAEQTQNAQALLMLYGQAVTSPDLARAAITQLLSNYWNLRNGAQTAEQATQAVAEAELRFQVFQAAQNQVLVQQNQQILQQNARIIALLEAQNRTRGGR